MIPAVKGWGLYILVQSLALQLMHVFRLCFKQAVIACGDSMRPGHDPKEAAAACVALYECFESIFWRHAQCEQTCAAAEHGADKTL